MLVGVPRFELGTSRTRTVRSTGLSHTPYSVRIIPPTFFYASDEVTPAVTLLAGGSATAATSRNLWIQQYFLAVDIKQAIDSIIILTDRQARNSRF